MYESDDVSGRAGRLASSTVAMLPTPRPLRFGMVGTYPPTRCGIASFTASLARAIAGAAPGCQFGVVACVDAHAPAIHSSQVMTRLVAGSLPDRVEFDDGYHTIPSIQRRIREADVVLLPYRSREQVVSGVLVEAIASGKPVVATRFPHAVELVSEGSGLLVRHDDPDAIASALRALLTDRELMAKASAVARRQAARHLWENVGRSYLALVSELVPRTSLAVAAGQVSNVSDPRTREYLGNTAW